MWKLWFTGILGFLLIAINFMSLSVAALGWTLTFLGLGIIFLSVWSLLEREADRDELYKNKLTSMRIDMMRHGHKS